MQLNYIYLHRCLSHFVLLQWLDSRLFVLTGLWPVTHYVIGHVGL